MIGAWSASLKELLLDLYTDDQATEVEWLTALGADSNPAG